MDNIVSLLEYVHPITGGITDFDALLDHVADASIVMLGEATHGTYEFYKARAEITKRLIIEKDFNTIALEADWPDVYRVNNYINLEGNDKSGIDSLGDFKRFPSWMWRNIEFLSFVDWLHDYNKSTQDKKKYIDIYGLDVYSLYKSIEIVLNELQKINSEAADEARKRYQCFDAYIDPQEYGYISSILPDKSCKDEVIKQLIDLKKRDLNFFKGKNLDPLKEKFYLEQNALIVKNAEEHYTSLFEGVPADSWNIRDKHMMETINAIVKYNREINKSHKIVIWAHNSHVGNARATQMSKSGEINIGQLVKETFGSQAISIGFTTYTGSVSAASTWDGPVERKFVRPALESSIEYLFHAAGVPAFSLILDEHSNIYAFFNNDTYLERAIGVVYLPETERKSHYFNVILSQQFDMIIHYDETHAVTPLEKTSKWVEGEGVPELFPFGV